jgi:ATPase subunit of ABC transporter with duplicated ATPase domains
LVVEDIQPSTRKYPAIIFKAERDCGDQLLKVEALSKISNEGLQFFSDITFSIAKGDKIAVISKERRAVTAFFEIITGNDTATEELLNGGLP